MNLTEIKKGQTVTVSTVRGHHHIHERLSEMGFVPGHDVTLLYKAPGGTPLVFSVMGTQVALRRDEARNVLTGTERQPDTHVLSRDDIMSSMRASVHRIDKLDHFGETEKPHCPGTCQQCNSCPTAPHIRSGKHDLTIALIGNPNCGKTSLFNAISGGHEHTGNYSGVTVHSIEGETRFNGKRLRVIDLPGTYSLHAFSPEEAYVAHELQKGDIDVIVNVIDVNNLERNLLLTLQAKMLDIPMVGALNMYDEFRVSGSRLDTDELSRRIGMPMVTTVARTHEGVDELLNLLTDRSVDLNKQQTSIADTPTFQHIDAILKDIYAKRSSRAEQRTDIIDRFAAASWLAYPVFALLLWFMFWLTFTLGQYPMDWIDAGVEWLGESISTLMSGGWLCSMLVDGIIAGVGSVIVFLPNILILYCLMSMLEDSGYLARAAMLADPTLSRFGLHGKSFIPMLMGFGCNVPAVMATRTIETGKSRLLTLFVIPLMSCSARIPVYAAFAGAFFLRHASLVMLALYSLGIVTAIIVAAALNRGIMRGYGSHFVMELPPYRLPDWSEVWIHTWEKGRQYLRKMGGIILLSSMAIWGMNYVEVDNRSVMEHIGCAIEPAIRPLGFDWRMGVGIVAGVGAKELMVSTLGVLYAGDDTNTVDDEGTQLQTGIAANTTPSAALAYMVFALLYFPCIATIVAIKNETGHWHHAAFVAAYTTILAWLCAFAVYNIATAFNL